MKVVVKYFSEITIKSLPVRKHFMNKLKKNIKDILNEIGMDIKIYCSWDNIIIEFSDHLKKQICNNLLNIPGISHFFIVENFLFENMDNLILKVADNYKDKVENKTIAVRVKRVGKHSFKSYEVEEKVSSYLFKKFNPLRSDLKNPDVNISLEIRKDQVFLLKQRFEGLGGFPIGSMEHTLTLISGGYDSSVASYMMLRRGFLNHFIFFNLGGAEHRNGVIDTVYYLWLKYMKNYKILFIEVNFNDILDQILTKVDKSYMGVILKRKMIKAASAIAEKLEIESLTTGESLSQVSSQTLSNLVNIDNSTDKLILRPLSTFHKQEIINIAQNIGTSKFAETMQEYCGVISVNPTTRSKKYKIDKIEEILDVSVLQKAIENANFSLVKNLLYSDENEVKCIFSIDKEILIDVRVDCEYVLENSIHIPFYSIQTKFKTLDQNRVYALYCNKGILSKASALRLKEQGFKNVVVYLDKNEY